jgi:NitT/TauT family transport system permease protein
LTPSTPTLATRIALPTAFVLAVLIVWTVVTRLHVVPAYDLPMPGEVLTTLREEATSGRLFTDIVASLWRVCAGFALSVVTGVPLGLWMGLKLRARLTLLPAVNFLRNLSPLAWITFAIQWFGVGDSASIFLIFLAAFCPIALGTMAAVASVPSVYFRVAREYGVSGPARLWSVTLPAIAPQLITTLRLTAGLCWLVDVAAEMIAGRDGLGFLIWDARNGLRLDLQIVGMLTIGIIGVAIDRLLALLTTLPSVRWGYER